MGGLCVVVGAKTSALAAAGVAGGRDAVTGPDLDVGFRVVGCCGSHPLLDLAGHGQEGLLDVAGVLGGGFQEWDSQAVGEFLKGKRVSDRE